MLAFLIIGYMHLMIYGVICLIAVLFLCRRRNRRDQKDRASKEILKNLWKKKVKFSSLKYNAQAADPEAQPDSNEIGDNSCIICWTPYASSDDVILLDCNEKHFFHAQCLESWVKARNNSCPMCR